MGSRSVAFAFGCLHHPTVLSLCRRGRLKLRTTMAAWWLRSVLLEVSDAARALDWYINILGFGQPRAEELPYNSELVTVRPPGSRLLVQLLEKPQPRTRETGLTFLVEDVEGLVSDLEAKNVRISQRPTWQAWGTTARFSDPDGNEIEVCSSG